jgi:hypothetical protein
MAGVKLEKGLHDGAGAADNAWDWSDWGSWNRLLERELVRDESE